MADAQVETLFLLSPLAADGSDKVSLVCRELLLDYLALQAALRPVFGELLKQDTLTVDSSDLSRAQINVYLRKLDKYCEFDFERLATLLLAQAVLQYCNDDAHAHDLQLKAKLCRMVNADCLRNALDTVYKSTAWKKLGFYSYAMVFPHVVHCGSAYFSHYCDQSAPWGKLLLDRVADPHWLRNLHRLMQLEPAKQGDYRKDFNVQMVKLHLLDPPSVWIAYEKARQIVPQLQLELVTTDYLGGPLDVGLYKSYLDTIGEASRGGLSSIFRSDVDDSLTALMHIVETLATEGKRYGIWSGYQLTRAEIIRESNSCTLL